MEAHQNSSEAHSSEDIDQKQDIDYQKTHFFGQVEAGEGDDDLDEDKEREETGGGNEGKEVTVISFTHASTDPGTVVIEPLHADIAIVTMRCPGWPVNITGVAEFHPQVMCLDWHGVDLL